MEKMKRGENCVSNGVAKQKGHGGRGQPRTHLDRKERDGGRPLLALPLGLSWVCAWEPRWAWPLSVGAASPAL